MHIQWRKPSPKDPPNSSPATTYYPRRHQPSRWTHHTMPPTNAIKQALLLSSHDVTFTQVFLPSLYNSQPALSSALPFHNLEYFILLPTSAISSLWRSIKLTIFYLDLHGHIHAARDRIPKLVHALETLFAACMLWGLPWMDLHV